MKWENNCNANLYDVSVQESPTWKTSGITSGMQVMSATAGNAAWIIEGTSAIESIGTFFAVEESKIDLSEAITEDDNLMHSIRKAKNEMRRGDAYFSHEDVFGR